MSESVELKVPYSVSALERAASMLSGMAEDLQGGARPTQRVADMPEPPVRDLTNEGKQTVKAPEADYPDDAEVEGGAAPGPEYPDGPEFEGYADRTSEPAPGPSNPAEEPAPPNVQARQTPDVDLDKAGLPWNGDIHSRNKSKDKAGYWKKRRRPQDLTEDQWKAKVESVEQDLRSLMAITNEADNQPEPGPSPEDAFGTGEPAPGPVEEAPAPPGPAAPGPAAEPEVTPPPVADDAPQGFNDLMHRVTAAVHAKKITSAEVNEIVKSHGVAALPMLGANPQAVQKVWPDIKAAIDRG